MKNPLRHSQSWRDLLAAAPALAPQEQGAAVLDWIATHDPAVLDALAAMGCEVRRFTPAARAALGRAA